MAMRTNDRKRFDMQANLLQTRPAVPIDTFRGHQNGWQLPPTLYKLAYSFFSFVHDGASLLRIGSSGKSTKTVQQ